MLAFNNFGSSFVQAAKPTDVVTRAKPKRDISNLNATEVDGKGLHLCGLRVVGVTEFVIRKTRTTKIRGLIRSDRLELGETRIHISLVNF